MLKEQMRKEKEQNEGVTMFEATKLAIEGSVDSDQLYDSLPAEIKTLLEFLTQSLYHHTIHRCKRRGTQGGAIRIS